jgi:hypothetical protein
MTGEHAPGEGDPAGHAGDKRRRGRAGWPRRVTGPDGRRVTAARRATPFDGDRARATDGGALAS